MSLHFIFIETRQRRGDVGTSASRSISQAWKSRRTYVHTWFVLAASRKLHPRQEIKRTGSRVENLQKTDSSIAREHFASPTEFLRGPANSDKQFTIDPCSFSGHVISLWRESFTVRGTMGEAILREIIVKALSFYGEQSQRLADGRFILYQGSDRSHFLSISRWLVMHSCTRTCSAMPLLFQRDCRVDV